MSDENTAITHVLEPTLENKEPEVSNRNPDGTIKKGVTGNPGGRPKLIAEFHKDLKENKYKPALAALSRALSCGDPKVELMAAREVFDRLFGKVVQQIEGKDGGPIVIQYDVLGMLKNLAGVNEV